MPKYRIHFNGGTPFVVDVNKTKKTATIYSIDDKKEPIATYKYRNIFLGSTPKFPSYVDVKKFLKEAPMDFSIKGNSILLELKRLEYVFIGNEIYSFKTKSPITEFYSPICRNDVAYPYAFTDKLVYYLIEGVTLPACPVRPTHMQLYFPYTILYLDFDKMERKIFKKKMIRKRDL